MNVEAIMLRLFFLLAFFSHTASADDLCARRTCRPETHVKVWVDAQRAFEVTMPPLPYVFEGMSRVLPGDDFYITGEIVDGKLIDLRHVAPPKTPVDVIRIRFSQQSAGGKPIMQLTITSYFKQTLHYKAQIQPAGGDAFQPTTVCALKSGRPVFESWPGGLMSIVVERFDVVADTTPCK